MDGGVLWRMVVRVLRHRRSSQQHQTPYRRTHLISPLPRGLLVKPESLPTSSFGHVMPSITTPRGSANVQDGAVENRRNVSAMSSAGVSVAAR